MCSKPEKHFTKQQSLQNLFTANEHQLFKHQNFQNQAKEYQVMSESGSPLGKKYNSKATATLNNVG